MKRLTLIAVAFVALASFSVSAGAAGPVTKQNGSAPAFGEFTAICGIPGYLFYGNCSGNASKYAEITGKVNAIQAKAGRWNLGISFKNVTPGATYRLWGNRNPETTPPGVVVGFFVISSAVAAANGTVSFSYQTDDPSYLSFDLNVVSGPSDVYGITTVTSYWSDQKIQVLNSDGTLYVPTP